MAFNIVGGHFLSNLNFWISKGGAHTEYVINCLLRNVKKVDLDQEIKQRKNE